MLLKGARSILLIGSTMERGSFKLPHKALVRFSRILHKLVLYFKSRGSIGVYRDNAKAGHRRDEPKATKGI